MSFSIFTFITTQILISFIIFFTYFFAKNNALICKYGIYFILTPLLACLLRIIFPLETTFTIVLPSSYALTNLYNFFAGTIMGYKISTIILFIMVAGMVVFSVLLLKDFYYLHKLAHDGMDLMSVTVITDLLNRIKEKHGVKKDIKVIMSDGCSTPFVSGYINPTIFLPSADYEDDKKLSFMLEHEVVHWAHHDLWLKLLVQIICIIHWWNPSIYLLRGIINQFLELKCDANICKDLTKDEKTDYLHTIYEAIDLSSNSVNTLLVTSGFARSTVKENMIQRFEMVYAYNHRTAKSKWFSIAFSAVMFVLTYAIVIQPVYSPTSDDFVNEDGREPVVVEKAVSYVEVIDGEYYLIFGDDPSNKFKLTQSQLEYLISDGIEIIN